MILVYSDDPDNFGESIGFSECCDSRADGDSSDSGENGDFVKYGETGDSAYSDEFYDSSEYGNSGDSCDCDAISSARNKYNLFESFILVLVRKVVSFQNYAKGGGGEVG